MSVAEGSRGRERPDERAVASDGGALVPALPIFVMCGVVVAGMLLLPACEQTCSLAIVEPRIDDAGLTVRTSVEPLQRFVWTVDVDLVVGLADGTEVLVEDWIAEEDVLDLTTPETSAFIRFAGVTPLPEAPIAVVTFDYPGSEGDGSDDRLRVHAWIEQYDADRLPDPVPVEMRITATRIDGQRRFECLTPRSSNLEYEVTPARNNCGDRWWFWSLDTTCEWQVVS
jgi:hypothetical protein